MSLYKRRTMPFFQLARDETARDACFHKLIKFVTTSTRVRHVGIRAWKLIPSPVLTSFARISRPFVFQNECARSLLHWNTQCRVLFQLVVRTAARFPHFFAETNICTYVRMEKYRENILKRFEPRDFFSPPLPAAICLSIVFKFSRPSLTILLAELPLHFLRAASQFMLDLTGKTSFYTRALSWSPNDIRPAPGAWKIIHPSVFLAFRWRAQSCPNLIGKRKKRKEEVKNETNVISLKCFCAALSKDPRYGSLFLQFNVASF